MSTFTGSALSVGDACTGHGISGGTEHDTAAATIRTESRQCCQGPAWPGSREDPNSSQQNTCIFSALTRALRTVDRLRGRLTLSARRRPSCYVYVREPPYRCTLWPSSSVVWTGVVSGSLRWLPLTVVATEIVAVSCQFIQHTDSRFPLAYFTVLSGVLAGLVAACDAAVPARSALRYTIRITSTVGVVISAIIFAALIAPASPTGTWFQPWDDGWVRTATVLFHAVAPVLVIADLCLRRPQLSRGQWMLATYSWPLTYLVGLAAAATVGDVTIPYPFLSPSQMGWGIVVVAIASLAGITGFVGVLLYYGSAMRSHRRR